jgi:23S rRNA (adenine2503-C2)-methyltransferase
MCAEDRRLERLTDLDPRVELLSLLPAELETSLSGWLADRGEPSYRVAQIVDAVYRHGATGWAAITTLPIDLRAQLEADYRFPSIVPHGGRESVDRTRKFLWKLVDGESVESVLIPTQRRDTICISSQVGCPLACAFCATGMFGYRRNLTAGEIVDQARRLKVLRGRSDVGMNVVFMGMGEPLLNWNPVAAALQVLIDPRGLDLGARRVTVSTVGVPEGIVALGERFPQVRLAVSLHAARDEVRDKIVPLNRRHPLRELIAACRVWAESTGKRLSFEYVHLPGVNDGVADAVALAELLKRVPAKVNLMRYNPVEGLGFRRPSEAETMTFRDAVTDLSQSAITVRKSRGIDIEGACGQLRLAREAGAVVAEVGGHTS